MHPHEAWRRPATLTGSGANGADGPEGVRAGISTFELSRYMGASLTMIDRHYGHLARDGREHAIRLLDELSAGQRPRWTLVDAAWTPTLVTTASQDNRNIS
jgi:hypothetical protein